MLHKSEDKQKIEISTPNFQTAEFRITGIVPYMQNKYSAYVSGDGGWNGIPASSFIDAMITACKLVGSLMKRAKPAVFILADGFDEETNTPLVKIIKGTPHRCDMPVRLDPGVCDIRPLPVWNSGWEAMVRIRFDADMFDAKDIANLLMRAGLQVGIGEGRNDSKKSNGIGYGIFTIAGVEN